jgi:hypothetical protein
MEVAAALAAGYLLFRESDAAYAAKLLQHARQLQAFGEECPGDYIVKGALWVGDGGFLLCDGCGWRLEGSTW